MRLRLLGIACASALLLLSGCASADKVADASNENTAATEDDSSEEDPDEEDTEDPEDDPTDDGSKNDDKFKPTEALPTAGDCYRVKQSDLNGDASPRLSKTVPCASGHNMQTFSVRTAKNALGKALAKNSPVAFDIALPLCRSDLPAWIGGEPGHIARTRFDVSVTLPDGTTGATWVRCDLLLYGLNDRPAALPKTSKNVLTDPNSATYDWCIRGPLSDTSSPFVPCESNHTARAVSTLRLGDPSGAYPGQDAISSRLDAECKEIANASIEPGETVNYGWRNPTKEEWKTSTGYGTCYLEMTD